MHHFLAALAQPGRRRTLRAFQPRASRPLGQRRKRNQSCTRHSIHEGNPMNTNPSNNLTFGPTFGRSRNCVQPTCFVASWPNFDPQEVARSSPHSQPLTCLPVSFALSDLYESFVASFCRPRGRELSERQSAAQNPPTTHHSDRQNYAQRCPSGGPVRPELSAQATADALECLLCPL